jgi:hypothetical protein
MFTNARNKSGSSKDNLGQPLITEGMKALRNQLGVVEAERFITLIRRDNFDYTEWQRELWPDKSVDEIFAAAKEFPK